MNKARVFALCLVLFIGLFALSGIASAQSVIVQKVEVDDLDVTTSTSRLDVERGDKIEISVWFLANATTKDWSLDAEITNYEFGDVEAETALFDIEAGNTYRKSITLAIPNDIEASETHDLIIDLENDNERVSFRYTLNVDERRHDLNIFDVIVQPRTATAGQPVFVQVLLENLGDKKEQDFKGIISIPELGIVAQAFGDDLVTEIQEENERFDDDEEDSAVMDFVLRLPEDAASGTYDMEIVVDYNRGHDSVSAIAQLTVLGREKAKMADTIINVDSTSREVTSDAETAYKVQFANVGNEKGVYSLTVEGEDLFADSRVDPSFVTVMPDGTSEAIVYLKAKDGVKAGSYNFVVRVNSGREIVQELNLQARVAGTGVQLSGLKQAVMILGIVLVIVLIVLILVLVFKKLGEGRAPKEETGAAEGQSYYYYPKH